MIYNFKQFKLNELKNITLYEPSDYNGSYIISYKGDIWILNEDNFDDNIEIVLDKINIKNDFIDLNELINYLTENKPYILTAYINNNKIYIDGVNNEFRHSNISHDLKKIKKELNMPIVLTFANDFYFNDINEVQIDTDIDLNNITYYHGTSIKYLNDILRKGLMPNPSNNNYKNIKHNKDIFLTLNKEKAFEHSRKTAMNTNSYPIIIETKIPDKAKLNIDYDLALYTYGINSDEIKSLGYDKIEINNQEYYKNIEKNLTYKDEGFRNIINKIGIVSYRGRIPSTFIENIIIDLYNYGGYHIGKNLYDELDITSYESPFWSQISPFPEWDVINKNDILNFLEETENNAELDSDIYY